MKMETTAHCYDGIAVFDEPLEMNMGKDMIYGVLFNSDREKEMSENGNDISTYMDYLKGMSQLTKTGKHSDDGEIWEFPEFRLTVTDPKGILDKFVTVIMKGMSEFRKYTFDRPVEWEEGEVDTETSGIIINDSLIKRYVSDKTTQIHHQNKPT